VRRASKTVVCEIGARVHETIAISISLIGNRSKGFWKGRKTSLKEQLFNFYLIRPQRGEGL
jgi:hypothetical protein